MALLIVNADDFGLTEQINRAVLLAHRSGILTSASLMVAEPGFPAAVAIARANPTLGVGLHVVTTFDRPVLPSADIAPVVTTAGTLLRNPLRAGLAYAFSRRAQFAIDREMRAQFGRFAETGLPWDHVDGHQHFHMHPFVFRRMLDLCDEYGAHRIRVPREGMFDHLRRGNPFGIITLASLVLQLMSRANRRTLLRRAALGGRRPFVCDYVFGDYQSSNVHADYLRRLLPSIPEGVSEVYSHPGSAYALRLPENAVSNEVRDVELHALLDPAVRAAVEACGHKLVTYADAERATALQESPSPA